MARGADGKARRKNAKKEARAAEAAAILGEDPKSVSETFDGPPIEEDDDDASEEEIDFDAIGASSKKSGADDCCGKKTSKEDDEELKKKIKKAMKKRARQEEKMEAEKAAVIAAPKKKIKPLPLIMLVMLTGTTLLPAILYAGDWLGNTMQKNNLLGSVGYKFGIGASPQKRVLSFYEKHDPTKIASVPAVMSKYYGSYPKLIKKLERKYQDYGYFYDWEEDESPYKLAKEQLELTAEYMGKQFQIYAPAPIKTGVRNMRYNIGTLFKKGKKIWKAKIWPALEPIFGVPDGAAAQKKKDAAKARKGKKGRRNAEYRDEDEF